MAMERHAKAERREISHIRRLTGSSHKGGRDGEECAGAKREEKMTGGRAGARGRGKPCSYGRRRQKSTGLKTRHYNERGTSRSRRSLRIRIRGRRGRLGCGGRLRRRRRAGFRR